MLNDPAVQGNPLLDPGRQTAPLTNPESREVGPPAWTRLAPASTHTLCSLALNLSTVKVIVLKIHPITCNTGQEAALISAVLEDVTQGRNLLSIAPVLLGTITNTKEINRSPITIITMKIALVITIITDTNTVLFIHIAPLTTTKIITLHHITITMSTTVMDFL